MKLKFAAIFAMLNVFSVFGVMVKMPNSQVLQQRLDEIGMTHFAEKTKIVSRLADKEFEALGIAVAVETSIYDYNQYLKQPMMARMMEMNKPMLIKALLKDSPAGIKELEENGLL